MAIQRDPHFQILRSREEIRPFSIENEEWNREISFGNVELEGKLTVLKTVNK